MSSRSYGKNVLSNIMSTNHFSSENSVPSNILETDNSSKILAPMDLQVQLNNEQAEVYRLIKSWGFDYQVIKKLLDLNLNLEHLQNIESSDIQELFPLKDLAIRIKFKIQLKKWLTSELNKSESEVQIIESVAEPFPESESNVFHDGYSTSTEFNSEQFIKKEILWGDQLINSYKIDGILKEEHRKQIVESVIKCYIKDNEWKTTNEKFCTIAKNITDLFSTENVSTYYLKEKGSKNPKGKLYDKYRNLKFKLTENCEASTSKQREISEENVTSIDHPVVDINSEGKFF